MASPIEVSQLQPTSPSKDTNEKNASNNLSYSAASQQSLFPKRDQALVFDCVEGLNLTDYTCAVGEIVKPQNVIYAFRMSNNRVGVYLSSKELLETFTEQYKCLTIRSKEVSLRPLVTKLQRIIFSNVAPPIPHYILENQLDILNIPRCSPITTLRASIAKSGYEHVLSSRRQTYINPNDLSKLPEFIKITFEDINYYIYPSKNTLTCFHCKEEGHIAKHCPTLSVQQASNQENSNKLEDQPRKENSAHEIVPPATLVEVNINKPDNISDVASNLDLNQEGHADQTTNSANIRYTAGIKRNSPKSLSTASSQDSTSRPASINEPSSPINNIKKPATKKVKKNPSKLKSIDDIKLQIQSLETSINNKDAKYPLDFDNIANFLASTYRKPNVVEIAASFTKDTKGLVSMLSDIANASSDHNLQNRIKRLLNQLCNPSLRIDQSGDDSSSALDSATEFDL